jgi:molybdopterin molybdotransferase
MMARHMEKLDRVRARVLEAFEPLPVERVPLDEAAGRYLAEEVRAARAAPPFTCSAMDGYALRAADAPGPVSLPVGLTLYAGDLPARPLRPGEAARIFTGAPLPEGADTVVREEATRAEAGRVAVLEAPRRGENVRIEGEDVPRGGVALEAGTRLGARQVGLCAAVGVAEVPVRRRPRVALLATGDEVVRGLTPDSNGAAVAGLLRSLGALVSRRSVADDPEVVAAAIGEALASADAVVTIGGVSVGERDHVPAALGRLGAQVRVHGVPMKPGKPFLFASAGATPVLGLPGSPSACLVAFEVFARPALLRLAGASRLDRRVVRLPLAEPVSGRPGRARFLWAALDPDGRVRPLGRDAAQVRGPALADALVRLPEGTGDLGAGEEVEAWLLDDDAG